MRSVQARRFSFRSFMVPLPPVARRWPRASLLVFSADMPSFDTGRLGLYLQSGASVVFGEWACTSSRKPPAGNSGSATAGFRSTRPVWGATMSTERRTNGLWSFQSTHPVWGATGPCNSGRAGASISIHAPRVGCDFFGVVTEFNINISIHAPRVGRDDSRLLPRKSRPISIHAPRVGRDRQQAVAAQEQANFNPRAPCGVRPPRPPTAWSAACNFNPRTPCGVRRSTRRTASATWPFQSTHPVWGATKDKLEMLTAAQISIHAPRVGCDCGADRGRGQDAAFQSTHPVWGATINEAARSGSGSDFNPRTPCGVRPHRPGRAGRRAGISIHAPRVGCDQSAAWM